MLENIIKNKIMPYGDKKSYSFFKMKGWSPFHQDEEGGDEKKPKKKKKDSNPCNEHFLKWNDRCNAWKENGYSSKAKCSAYRIKALIEVGCHS